MSNSGKSADKSNNWILIVFFIVFMACIFLGPPAFQLWMQHVKQEAQQEAVATQSQ